jgi:hypothetical protein
MGRALRPVCNKKLNHSCSFRYGQIKNRGYESGHILCYLSPTYVFNSGEFFNNSQRFLDPLKSDIAVQQRTNWSLALLANSTIPKKLAADKHSSLICFADRQ